MDKRGIDGDRSSTTSYRHPVGCRIAFTGFGPPPAPTPLLLVRPSAPLFWIRALLIPTSVHPASCPTLLLRLSFVWRIIGFGQDSTEGGERFVRREVLTTETLTRRRPVSVQTFAHEPSPLLFGKVAPRVPGEVQGLSLPPAPRSRRVSLALGPGGRHTQLRGTRLRGDEGVGVEE